MTGNLPNWNGAAAVYGKAYRLLAHNALISGLPHETPK